MFLALRGDRGGEPGAPLPRLRGRDGEGARSPASGRGEARSRLVLGIVFIIVALLALPFPAFADLRLCNRTSYVLDLALGLEDKGSAASRGWFRVEPGACKTVLQGALEAEKVYVHARALTAYGASPLPQAGHADFCVADTNFIIAGAKACNSRNQS